MPLLRCRRLAGQGGGGRRAGAGGGDGRRAAAPAKTPPPPAARRLDVQERAVWRGQGHLLQLPGRRPQRLHVPGERAAPATHAALARPPGAPPPPEQPRRARRGLECSPRDLTRPAPVPPSPSARRSPAPTSGATRAPPASSATKRRRSAWRCPRSEDGGHQERTPFRPVRAGRPAGGQGAPAAGRAAKRARLALRLSRMPAPQLKTTQPARRASPFPYFFSHHFSLCGWFKTVVRNCTGCAVTLPSPLHFLSSPASRPHSRLNLQPSVILSPGDHPCTCIQYSSAPCCNVGPALPLNRQAGRWRSVRIEGFPGEVN